jgi:hypothetical protein
VRIPNHDAIQLLYREKDIPYAFGSGKNQYPLEEARYRNSSPFFHQRRPNKGILPHFSSRGGHIKQFLFSPPDEAV